MLAGEPEASFTRRPACCGNAAYVELVGEITRLMPPATTGTVKFVTAVALIETGAVRRPYLKASILASISAVAE